MALNNVLTQLVVLIFTLIGKKCLLHFSNGVSVAALKASVKSKLLTTDDHLDQWHQGKAHRVLSVTSLQSAVCVRGISLVKCVA